MVFVIRGTVPCLFVMAAGNDEDGCIDKGRARGVQQALACGLIAHYNEGPGLAVAGAGRQLGCFEDGFDDRIIHGRRGIIVTARVALAYKVVEVWVFAY